MERFNDAAEIFDHAIERARKMIDLYDALTTLRPKEPTNDDALRSAYFQVVSSFDFFAHEILIVEASYRFSKAIKTRNITLPMEIMTIPSINERINASDEYIRASNSHKALVDPGKLSEALSCYCNEPWKKICDRFNLDDKKTSDTSLKGQLKAIWKRRNQIAHSADVDPTLTGICLWPINKEDTVITIDFIESLGKHLPYVISQELCHI